MPPTSNFGQDITNTTPNDTNNNGDGSGNGGGLPNIEERMGGTMIFSRLAGRGVIRVVGRCEDAKENNNLGKCFDFILLYTSFHSIFFSNLRKKYFSSLILIYKEISNINLK